MKESIEATTLMQIVIVFIFLFTGIICISLNFSNAYKTKNDIVKYIERYGIDKAIDEEFVSEIKKNHSVTGNCDNINNVKYECAHDSSNGCLFCYQERVNNSAGELKQSKYYNVVVFYRLDLPILSGVTFKVSGSTKNIYNTVDTNTTTS